MAKKSNWENENVRSIVSAHPENHGALGKRIELGARSHITKNKSVIDFITWYNTQSK